MKEEGQVKRKMSMATVILVVAAVLALSLAAVASAGGINAKFSVSSILRSGIMYTPHVTVVTYNCNSTRSGIHTWSGRVTALSGMNYRCELRRNRTLLPDIAITGATRPADGLSRSLLVAGVDSTGGQKFHWDCWMDNPKVWQTGTFSGMATIGWP